MNKEISTSSFTISTAVYIANIDTTFDLYSIFRHINIDDTILGVKYNNNIKGNMKQTGSFFNQLTVKIFIDFLNKETNVKVFPNGKFQISGVKNDNQASHSIKIFLEKIINIKGKYLQNVIVDNGIIYNKYEYDKLHFNVKYDRFNFIRIYKEDNGNFYYLGEKKNNDKYIINKKYVNFCNENNFFVDKSHVDFVKNIYDVNGNNIGCYKYIMTHKRKNLILHNSKFILKNENIYDIYNKYDQKIGERHFIPTNIKPTYNKKLDNILLYYDSIENQDIKKEIISKEFFKNDFINKINLKITNINSNFSFDLNNQMLDKINIHNIMTEKYNILSYYKPDSKYQAINIRMYFDENYNIIQVDNKYAHRFTVTIFQNGKIMISGCKNKSQIVIVKKKLIEIFSDNIDDFIIKQNTNVVVNNEQLSIWDIV